MSPFKKKRYTEPIISNHDNNIEKDWYVSFRFKNDGKVHKFKRREGVNRLKNLQERLNAIAELRVEIAFDLKHGWNPILDPKRENDYNPYLYGTKGQRVQSTSVRKKPTKEELFNKYYLKGL